VDERPYGGTCALRGCDPKKILVGAAELKDWSDRMRGSSIAGETRIEWADLMRFKRTFTDPVPEKREADLIKAGVTTYHGAARFSGPASLSVAGDLLPARHIVLATGARPTTLELDGEAHLITSTDFLDLQRLPRRICFIGGGYIAFEFAHVAARAGASPVILQRGPRVLAGFEPGLVDRIVDVSRAIGIDVRTGVQIDVVEKHSESFRVVGHASGAAVAIDCDLVTRPGALPISMGWRSKRATSSAPIKGSRSTSSCRAEVIRPSMRRATRRTAAAFR
jgi:glutathione reductase (NADPH)